MSNRRRPTRGNAYLTGYLKSPAWFARRDRWFRTRAHTGRPMVCAACLIEATPGELELHHLDYTGVIFDGGWKSRERQDDLVPLHPSCHELLHRLIERDQVLAQHRARRAASELALSRLQAKLTAGGGAA